MNDPDGMIVAVHVSKVPLTVSVHVVSKIDVLVAGGEMVNWPVRPSLLPVDA